MVWKHSVRHAFGSLLLVAWLMVLPAAAQLPAQAPELELSPAVTLENVSNAARLDLERIQEFLADEQWDEAVETLRRVMENNGDEVIRLGAATSDGETFARYTTLRQYGQLRLAAMADRAPQALQLYRNRVDPLAERWYRESLENLDDDLLRRLVDQLFLSSYGDEAILRLGDLQFERGNFTTARGLWERLSPQLRAPVTAASSLSAPTGSPLWLALRGVNLDEHWETVAPQITEGRTAGRWLVYPDTDLDLAAVRARLVLVSILEGSLERARIELDVLRRLHGDAAGVLGGRRGPYVNLLAKLLSESEQWPTSPGEQGWRTFAGDADRNSRVDRGFEPGGVRWSVPLPPLSAESEKLSAGRPRIAEARDRLLSYHPLISEGRVIVSGPDSIRVFDAATGEAAFPGGQVPGEVWRPVDPVEIPAQRYVGVPRYTLSLRNHRLLARMGSPITSTPRDTQTIAPPAGVVVGVDLSKEGKMLPGFPLRPEDPAWAFEGTPLLDARYAYVAMRQRSDVKSRTYVACYELNGGQLRWRTAVSSAESLGHGQLDELSHNLLTLHEGTLYYNSNHGAVAALRADDGELQWLVGYPRVAYRSGDPDHAARNLFRDLTPCVVHRDVVYVAPADCDRLFALDAASGRLLWTTRPERAADAVHLLGVRDGALIASGDYLYWFDAWTGRLLAQFPGPRRVAPGHARPSPHGYGRGLLAGRYVYWPTPEALYVFTSPSLDQPSQQPRMVRRIELAARGLTGGNLATDGDTLLLATSDRLYAFDLYDVGAAALTRKSP